MCQYNKYSKKSFFLGVYVGLSCIDAYGGRENEGRSTNILGALAANRISFSFDFKGPSYVCDTACSTSLYALVNAYKDMERGEIEHAIVAATNVNFDPYETVEYLKAGILSIKGHCQSFCMERDGYVRSEAVVAMLLQRKSCARRIYSSIATAKLGADGFKREGANYPSTKAQFELMKSAYEEKNIDVEEFAYFEAHGTGKFLSPFEHLGKQKCFLFKNFFRHDVFQKRYVVFYIILYRALY